VKRNSLLFRAIFFGTIQFINFAQTGSVELYDAMNTLVSSHASIENTTASGANTTTINFINGATHNELKIFM
jgi:hypothetical protein